MASYKVLGIDDSESTCCKCGKKNLKRVVWLEVLDADGNGTGETLHVGTDCAGQMVHGKKTRKNGENVAHEAKAIEYAKKWLAKGRDTETVINGVWNCFGLCNARQIVEVAQAS